VEGSVSDFSIRNGEIIGDGRLESRQVALLTSGVVDQTSTYDGFVASDLVLKNCMNGLQVVCPRNGRIERVHIVNTLGVQSGTGYGIGFANVGGADCENMTVADCTFAGTTRHGLYLGGAKHVRLHNLSWYSHAPGETATHGRSALAISRSQNVVGNRLRFYDCADECIGIDDDEGGYTLQDVALSDIAIHDARAVALRIGVATPWIDGKTEVTRVVIDGLELKWAGSPGTYPVLLQEAKHVTVRNITASSTGSVGGIIRLVPGEFPHRDFITLSGMAASVPPEEYLVTIPTEVLTGTAHIVIRGLQCTCRQPVAYQGGANITNQNLTLD
jgi:hypothetical protein